MTIKHLFNLQDDPLPEELVYYCVKDTLMWNMIVLHVRLHEMLRSLPFGHYLLEYPQDLVDIVNKWEKR